MTERAKFNVGQVVHHKLLNYRGIIVDVDPSFQSSDTWYDLMAISRPPKDKPWYHVLVDNADFMTYVSEQNLETDFSADPVQHPDLVKFFNIQDGTYISKRVNN